jgi:2-polyprenyl-6-methoxyphenol hydroxylase-like FAD-dependent oxidoreductase
MHTSNRGRHDVVVVGGRVAGAATAMLLARLGRDVVVVDRASFPSDTVSTHAIARSGVVQLRRWACSMRSWAVVLRPSGRSPWTRRSTPTPRRGDHRARVLPAARPGAAGDLRDHLAAGGLPAGAGVHRAAKSN